MTSFPFASIAAARAEVWWARVKTTARVPPTRGWVSKVRFILMWNEFVLWIMHHSTGDAPSGARWELRCVKAPAFCLSNERHFSVLRSNPQGFVVFFPPVAISLSLQFLLCHWREITSSPGFILRKGTKSVMSSPSRHILNNLSWPHQNPHLQRRCYICDLR